MKGKSRELLVGQLIGQLSLLASLPILTRLLAVEEMGVYQTAFSIALILQPLATLRREMLIPFSSTADATRHRVIGLGFAGVCAVLVAIAAGVAWLLGASMLAAILLSTSFVLLSFALMYIENALLIRQGELRRLAWRNLLGGVVSAALQILAAVLIPTAVTVALALLVGRAVATAITVARTSTGQEAAGMGERKSQRSISAILSAMVATASSQAVVIGSNIALGPQAAAQVAVGQRIASAPAGLVGQALTQIALGAAAPLIRQRTPGLTAMLRKQTLRTAAMAALCTVALMVGAPLLAVPILGPAYERAGVLTAVFAIPLSLTLVALPATSLLIPLGHERLLLGLQVGRLAAIVIAMSVASAASAGDVLFTSIVTSTVWTLAYAPLLAASFAATVAHDRSCSPGD